MSSSGNAPNGNHATVEYPSGPVAKAKKTKPVKYGSLMQLYRASRRPLPNKTGDGTYQVVKNRPSLMQDLSTITFQGNYRANILVIPGILTLSSRSQDPQGNYHCQAQGRDSIR